jgi:hypothetical protein
MLEHVRCYFEVDRYLEGGNFTIRRRYIMAFNRSERGTLHVIFSVRDRDRPEAEPSLSIRSHRLQALALLFCRSSASAFGLPFALLWHFTFKNEKVDFGIPDRRFA